MKAITLTIALLLLASAVQPQSTDQATPAPAQQSANSTSDNEAPASPKVPEEDATAATPEAEQPSTKKEESKKDNKKNSKDKGGKKEKEAKEQKQPKSDGVTPYPLDTCIVTENELGSMGDPVTFIYEKQEIKVCCKPCEKKFLKDPAKYLPRLTPAN